MGLAAPFTKEQTADFNELARVVKSGKCIAFVGAGLSRPQCLDLKSLVPLLCQECRVKVELLPEKDRTDILSLAHRAKQADDRKYTEVLLGEFGRPEPVSRQFALARIPFRAFVTLNYDPLLKKALEATSHKDVVVYAYPHLPACHLGDPGCCAEKLLQHSLYHIHGYIDHDTTTPKVVLTSQEYERAYDSTLLPSFITQLLAYFPTCFLGCSLSEDVLLREVIKLCRRIRRDLADRSPHRAPRSYMLIDADEHSRVDIDLDQHGITPVLFDRINDEYEGLDLILTEWAGMKPARVSCPFEGTKDLYRADQEPSP